MGNLNGTSTIKRNYANKKNNIQYCENKIVQNIILIWLDANISKSGKDFQYTFSQLNKIFNSITLLTDLEACRQFIETKRDEQIFLIVSGRFGKTLVPLVHKYVRLDSIYVFCRIPENHNWTKQWDKIKLVVKDIEPICHAIVSDAAQCEEDLTPTSILSANDSSNQDLQQVDSSFMYSQLIKDILLQMTYDERAIGELAEFCRNNFHENLSELKIIDEFQKDYHKHSPIWWYTRECFTYRMLNCNRAWIEFNIGRVLSFKREWNQARIYYDHAYERMMKHKPPRIKDSAHVLNNIACILPNQGKYDEALDYHQRALEIREKFYPSDHIDIAQSLYNIGRILDHQEKYDDAFEYYQGALKIQQKIYPSNHVNIARSLSNIGIILYRQGKCDEALDYHQRALKIREKIYPSDHIDIAYSLNNIGIILRNQGKYNEALDCYKKALNIEEKFYPSDHVDIAKSLSNIGNILSDQEKYQEALDYYQRALKIEERFYPSGHVDLAHSLNNIGICYENQNQREMALNYYQHALTIYEKYLPIDHPRRQKTEHNIRRLTKRNSFSK
ncbi:unnamed protein product [Rotaria sp. Silwood1]|nr:unnamed protein product [Rotaria sp. Silwood1]